jgi:hypothetical protein
MTRILAVGVAATLATALLPAGPSAIAPAAIAHTKTVVKKCTPGGKCSRWYVPKSSNSAGRAKGLKAR